MKESGDVDVQAEFSESVSVFVSARRRSFVSWFQAGRVVERPPADRTDTRWSCSLQHNELADVTYVGKTRCLMFSNLRSRLGAEVSEAWPDGSFNYCTEN